MVNRELVPSSGQAAEHNGKKKRTPNLTHVSMLAMFGAAKETRILAL